jgi:hypothetical protein
MDELEDLPRRLQPFHVRSLLIASFVVLDTPHAMRAFEHFKSTAFFAGRIYSDHYARQLQGRGSRRCTNSHAWCHLQAPPLYGSFSIILEWQ